MGHIEAERELPASVDAIWATISDPSTWVDWFTIHEKWLQEPPATLTPGAQLVAKIVMLGMANKIEWTVGSVEAPKHLTMSGTGMAGVKWSFTFILEPAGDNASWGVLNEVGGSDVKRLKRFAVRFAKMVFPGDDLETRIWKTGISSYAFETVRGEDFVITDGLAEIGDGR